MWNCGADGKVVLFLRRKFVRGDLVLFFQPCVVSAVPVSLSWSVIFWACLTVAVFVWQSLDGLYYAVLGGLYKCLVLSSLAKRGHWCYPLHIFLIAPVIILSTWLWTLSEVRWRVMAATIQALDIYSRFGHTVPCYRVLRIF